MKGSQKTLSLSKLRKAFGKRLQENVVMANYTTAHVGGPADAMLIIHDALELEDTLRKLWELDAPYYLFGSGSNLLVSDAGLHGVVLINRAKAVRIDSHSAEPVVSVESGANLVNLARQAALRGLSGLEWAASIPGTVGGAVYGNAGAYGGNIQGQFIQAELLDRSLGRLEWGSEQMDYGYRTSALKKQPGQAVILTTRLRLAESSSEAVLAKMDENIQKRRASQPPGASLGSMFKNPPGDYAGRLIEAAGLKGTRSGGVEISQVHANFFVNDDNATAQDYDHLIGLAQKTVFDKFGIRLELEIERIGEWPAQE